MKYRFIALIMLVLLILPGCGSQSRQEVETAINEAFRARADAVFLHKDKKGLSGYFSAGALAQSKKYLEWSPNGSWENKKDLKYRYNLRIDNLRVDGKTATAEVFETVVASWEYIDPSLVYGHDFKKEDAWTARPHKVMLQLNEEGRWVVEEDLMQ
ncbi:MAG: hypothetical protein ACOY4Q_14830 [Bacillota bacterium]